MTTGRINQVAFLIDADTRMNQDTRTLSKRARSRSHEASNACFGANRGRVPHTHSIFRIQEIEHNVVGQHPEKVWKHPRKMWYTTNAFEVHPEPQPH